MRHTTLHDRAGHDLDRVAARNGSPHARPRDKAVVPRDVVLVRHTRLKHGASRGLDGVAAGDSARALACADAGVVEPLRLRHVAAWSKTQPKKGTTARRKTNHEQQSGNSEEQRTPGLLTYVRRTARVRRTDHSPRRQTWFTPPWSAPQGLYLRSLEQAARGYVYARSSKKGDTPA